MEGSEKKSIFNSTVAILYRIDELWKDAHRHSRLASYGQWNEDLDRIWLELVDDADAKDREKMEGINKKIVILSIYSGTSKLKQSNPLLFNKLIDAQKKVLMEKEESLRKLQNKQGKGIAYQESSEEYMDEW